METAMPATRKPNSADRLKKMQIAMYLDSEQLEALRALSGKTRVPMQEYLRDGLDYVLARHGMKKGARK
jgi:hypothetical protein